jgi:hypothetical protein
MKKQSFLRQFPLLLLMLSADLPLGFFRFFCCHAVDMQHTCKRALVLILPVLSVFYLHWETGHGARLLAFERRAQIDHAVYHLRITQWPVMIPADNDVCALRADALENTPIGAISLIDDGHIAGAEVIMLQTLASLVIASGPCPALPR